MKLKIIIDTEKDICNERMVKEAKEALPEILKQSKINKNCLKWLNNEEINDVKIIILNRKIFSYEYRIYYCLNNKVLGQIRLCSGNKLDYYKITFMKNFNKFWED